MLVYVLSELYDDGKEVIAVFSDEEKAREMTLKWARDDDVSNPIIAEDAYCPEEYFSVIGNAFTNEDGRECFEYCCNYRLEAFDMYEQEDYMEQEKKELDGLDILVMTWHWFDDWCDENGNIKPEIMNETKGE